MIVASVSATLVIVLVVVILVLLISGLRTIVIVSVLLIMALALCVVMALTIVVSTGNASVEMNQTIASAIPTIRHSKHLLLDYLDNPAHPGADRRDTDRTVRLGSTNPGPAGCCSRRRSGLPVDVRTSWGEVLGRNVESAWSCQQWGP